MNLRIQMAKAIITLLSDLANMSTLSFQRGVKYLQPTYLSCSRLRRISTSIAGGSRLDRGIVGIVIF